MNPIVASDSHKVTKMQDSYVIELEREKSGRGELVSLTAGNCEFKSLKSIYKQMKKVFISIIILGLYSCSDFLDEKPRRDLVIPTNSTDLWGILDNAIILNAGRPALGLLSSDDLITDDQGWNSLGTAIEQQTYIWGREEGGFEFVGEWIQSYQKIFYANVVLKRAGELLESATGSEVRALQENKGTALFIRGCSGFDLLTLFSPGYHGSTSDSELGIILKTDPMINESTPRSGLRESFDQVLSDLQDAAALLAETVPSKNRPNKAAAIAQLAIVYHYMGKYEKSLEYALQVLDSNYELMDFNELDSNLAFPMTFLNQEVIYHARMGIYSFSRNPAVRIHPFLLEMLEEGDQRKNLFINFENPDYPLFRGSYTGSNQFFGGISLNEIYLIAAESFIRTDNILTGLEILNELLKKRYAPEAFSPRIADNKNEALGLILAERRKELMFRMNRWMDLKRLNFEPEFAKTLTRTVNNQEYQLEPLSNRYLLPISQDEIDRGVIAQNPF